MTTRAATANILYKLPRSAAEEALTTVLATEPDLVGLQEWYVSRLDLLRRTRTPTDADIESIDNVCRCGTYFRIRKAIERTIVLMDQRGMPVGQG